MGAEEALRVGLLNGITEPETLLDEPEALVREILSRSPVAVGLRCEAVHRGLGMTEEESAFR